MTHTDITETETWYVTFGLGSSLSGKYSEIVVPTRFNDINSDTSISWVVREIAYARYPRQDVAFFYPPERAKAAKLRAELHERITLQVES